MAVERIDYRAGNVACSGALVYDEPPAEAGVIEPLAPRQIVRVAIGDAGQRGAHAQRRPAVLRAEGIEVEGERG